MSLLDQIEEQGQRLTRSERKTQEALERLRETNEKLREEVESRRIAEKRLRILCDTMSNHSLSLPERIMIMLREACYSYGMDVGILARIEGQKYTILYSGSEQPREDLMPGMIYDLGNTFCQRLSQDGTSLGLDDVSKSDWSTHPLYVATKVESYLGVCVSIHQQFWGALCFSDLSKHDKPFNEPDHDFIRLMAQWIGAELS